MMAMLRKIVQIDEEQCDGCGLCASACAEGAIRIVDGKARLVSDTYCDGLGACIGECPQDAITIIEREAAVEHHLTSTARIGAGDPGQAGAGDTLACGCPGSMVRELPAEVEAAGDRSELERVPSQLRNWPVQMHLVPPNAPYLKGASLLLAADCVGFASPDFHHGFLKGKILIVGCPKLDDAAFYREKLAAILQENDIQDLTVAIMEVPCCSGLLHLARQAVTDSGKDVPLFAVKVGIGGDILEDERPARAMRV
jgi:Pyruvate/2-oxoacid:ferredoxin oxidoreductase delta subunit